MIIKCHECHEMIMVKGHKWHLDEGLRGCDDDEEPLMIMKNIILMAFMPWNGEMEGLLMTWIRILNFLKWPEIMMI